ncbi:MAG: type II toxin-antitoxin system RatA family toxin [Gammaproteobacteria bacterium]|nr:type II toxin-antitoxin system RatA family toxin [Gammaproteobacteria bacterium]
MYRVRRQVRVPYPAARMYDLVNDVESYPRFLPWCSRAEVLQRDGGQIVAALTLSLARMRLALTTRNTLVPGRGIRMQLVSGPFRCLEGAWRFDDADAPGSCRVSLELDFALRGRLLQLSLGPLLQRTAASMADAFVARAHELYRCSRDSSAAPP